MKLEDIQPADCYARAQRVLAEVASVRDEMGRTEDSRPAPEITGARPRECYVEALVAWRKVQRLASEVGVTTARALPPATALREVRPGHVLQVLDGVLATVGDIRSRLGISEGAPEPAIESSRQPSDVLMTVIRINRELSRSLERPFTPSDVYATVALASSYATRLGAQADMAPFTRKKKPADCYARLEACLAKATALVTAKGESALAARGTPKDIVPGDVYDLATLVLGEVALLHALTPNAAAVHAFEPAPAGHYLPAHVEQLARTLEAQLGAIK